MRSMKIETGDTVFLDTNILLIATDESREGHEAAVSLFARATAAGLHLAISGQVLREYTVVATRPLARNGLGLSLKDALANVREFRRSTVLCDETESVFDEWARLSQTCRATGARLHDVNIAATMLAHGVSCLVTENTPDFSGLPVISTLDLESAFRQIEAL